MTRPELHALVDIVMDARGKFINRELFMDIMGFYVMFYDYGIFHISSKDYPTFPDFTKAIQEYIKTLEG